MISFDAFTIIALEKSESCEVKDLIIYKELTIDDVNISMFACFDRTQNVTKCWRKINNEWVIKDIAFVYTRFSRVK